MRSPLEIIQGRFEHAVFATYSVNLRFFEDWVLPLLRATGVRNVTLLVDEAQLGVALADHSLRSLGRSYHAVSVRLGPGAFHPKLLLLAGENGARGCVSSANLTVDGQLRNVESAVVLDSTVAEHRQPIVDLASFIRSVAERSSPAHSADAIMAALAAVDGMPSERPGASLHVVHNLDRPLVHLFPAGGLTAVSPYVDSGEAATALAELGPLTLLTDDTHFAAPDTFFGASWTVLPLDFGRRRLHAKAYWGESESWLLLGSPNLSRQGLLQTAAQANTELAVAIAPHTPRLADPPGATRDPAQLAREAPSRHARAAALEKATAAEPGSFNAWEDEQRIVVHGVPPGATFEHWSGGTWHRLGEAVGDLIEVPDGVRPYLIRSTDGRGHVKHAIVHRTDQLRIHRLRPRTVSRAADVMTSLPIDLTGVQALESVLRDLYLLESLSSAEVEHTEQRGQETAGTQATAAGLGEWMPARPEDEPRVPDIYRRTWRNEPDALLALVRGALRLDITIKTVEVEPDSFEEFDTFEESLDFDGADRQVENADARDSFGEPQRPPTVAPTLLKRYRTSLVGLLRRGSGFVRSARDPALADLGFQAILALHERIERFPIEVDGRTETLIEPSELLRQKLELLDAYLRERKGREPLCLATARVHLARCLAARPTWTPLEWEQLERLAYRSGTLILAASTHAAAAALHAGESLVEVSERLRPYADRAEWEGFLVQADAVLDNADINTDPLIWAEGDEWIEALESSPAWRLIGYGAVAGFRDDQSYAVLVRNSLPRSTHLAHLLICEPAAHRLTELFLRATDHQWLARTYKPVSEGDIDAAGRFGVEGLLQAGVDRTSFAEVATLDGVVGSLLETIAARPKAGATRVR